MYHATEFAWQLQYNSNILYMIREFMSISNAVDVDKMAIITKIRYKYKETRKKHCNILCYSGKICYHGREDVHD